MINIFDFDNTLYYNKNNDFESKIILDNIIDINNEYIQVFFEQQTEITNILLSGRHISQKITIESELFKKEYIFDKIIFFPYSKKYYQKENFMEIYYQWKYIIIKKIQIKYYTESVNIIDDDKKVMIKFLIKPHQNINCYLAKFKNKNNYIIYQL